MVDKKIIKRIEVLEDLYPMEYVNVEEHTKEIITILEKALKHRIIINLPNKKYYDKETLEIDIYKLLPIEDLRTLAYRIKY